MARIVGVTFETEAHARPGHFSIPAEVARILRVRPNDQVQLVIQGEGFKVEVVTDVRSGLEVYHRSGDPSTAGLEKIPAGAALTVTVWHEADAPPDGPWTIARFDEELELQEGSEIVRRATVMRDWALERGARLWWGNGRKTGSWIPVFDMADGRRLSFFVVATNGTVGVQFGRLKNNSPGLAELPRREELRSRLNAIRGISLTPDVVDRWPSVRLDDLPDDEALRQLLETFDWVVAQVRDSVS